MSDLPQSPLRSPEYLAPVTPYVPVVPDPNRLCSSDAECGHGDAGCRRTDTILVWEQEFNKYVTGSEYWGMNDSFFEFEGVSYYYKPFLQKFIDSDKIAMAEEEVTLKSIIPDFDASNMSFVDMNTVIQAAPSGMPAFLDQTDDFYMFDSVGTNLITDETLTRDLLTKIQNTFFTGQYSIPCFGMCDSLYEKDGNLYWTDLCRWSSTSLNLLKQGISMVSADGQSRNFYPFLHSSQLSNSDKQIITAFGNYNASFSKQTFNIIDL
jgi:hypothetical protein